MMFAGQIPNPPQLHAMRWQNRKQLDPLGLSLLDESSPLPVTDRQSITRAELTAALRALQKKCPGIPLHLVTDSELVFMGLQGKCDQ